MNAEDRERGESEEPTDNLTSDGTDHRIVRELLDDGKSLGDCEIAYCADDATHLVVLDTMRSGHLREWYCESHVESAADDARADPTRDLVFGPIELG
ncbi:hypothetical protein [Natrinema gelatinilyticum]|uniref:hypothetical protein n=1 Tax=Natrinema gelatinilyticum TaxID=2961571 RepID=UPI0020C3E04A|nr:hypothetical protein [Natrinema gelatinilyticum]